ncbi:hypothetical protein NHX12_003138, partial [Muraenolepis orangiensis]
MPQERRTPASKLNILLSFGCSGTICLDHYRVHAAGCCLISGLAVSGHSNLASSTTNNICPQLPDGYPQLTYVDGVGPG